ncbi:hypothetical protein AgCh_012092 [Apium graveolens]
MNRIKLPIRERIGNVPQFPVGVDAVIAEGKWIPLKDILSEWKCCIFLIPPRGYHISIVSVNPYASVSYELSLSTAIELSIR